jgi:hypothetical protein
VVLTEVAEKMGVGDEAAPPLTDERGAGEGGRQRREAPEDLGQDVVVVQRGLRRRRAREVAAGSDHLAVPSTLLSSCFGAGSARRGRVPKARRGRRRRRGIGEIDTVARSFARCAGVEEMGEIAPESRRWGRMGGGVAEIGKGRDRARRERE